MAGDCSHRQPAGNFALIVAAHSICHDEKAKWNIFSISCQQGIYCQKSILVMLALDPHGLGAAYAWMSDIKMDDVPPGDRRSIGWPLYHGKRWRFCAGADRRPLFAYKFFKYAGQALPS